MNLAKKKALAVRALGVGKSRIVFLESRRDEIKEALTKQDIKDLRKEGAIVVKEIKGRKKIVGRKRKRGPGNIKKNINLRKKEYMTMTRKLRFYVGELKKKGELNKEDATDIRKKIRNKYFRSRNHLKEYIRGMKK